jgi:hypothetical protein
VDLMTTLSLPVRRPRFPRVRAAAVKAWRNRQRTAARIRARYRTPALQIGGFALLDASAWSTFGLGAGLLVLGAALFVYEWLGGDT